MVGIRPEILSRRFLKLEEFLNELRRLRDTSFEEFMDSREKQWAVERGLQLSIESILDIGNHLLSGLGLEAPDEYREVILGLGRAGVFPGEFAGRISGIAGFRNALVHDYANLDPQIVYDRLKNGLKDLEDCQKYIATYLKESGIL